MKRFIMILIIIICMCGISYATTESTIALINRNVKIQYEGNLQEFQNALGVRMYPLTYEGTTYLPIRAISSLFYSRIKWDGANNSIYLGEGELDTTSAKTAGGYLNGINEDITVLLNGDVKIYYQGKVQTFRDANGKIVYPLSYEGTTYLPVRSISNLFNLEIGWNAGNNTVSIHKQGTEVVVHAVGLNKTMLGLKKGENETLTAIITPTNATNQNILWTSSNTNVAIVKAGRVSAVKEGVATITVTTVEGEKQATCKVTVTSNGETETVPVESIALNKETMTIEEGKSEMLTATVKPSNATNQNVIWSSSNTSIATVSNGTVKAIKTGTVVITAKTVEGNKIASCNVTVKTATTTPVAVTGIQLNKTSTSLEVGKTEILTATITPTNATNKNVTWSSSNTNVATVSNGTVKAIKVGTAIITAKTIAGGKTASCIVTIKAAQQATVAVTSVKLNKSSIRLAIGKTETLTATITPTNATNKNVTWSSSNTNVASVSNGTVKAVKAGTAIITAKTINGGKIATCIVTVKAAQQATVAVTSVKLNKTNTSLAIGKTETLTATITPTNATNKNVAWSSSNTSIATVSNGTVKAIKAGTAIVTAKTINGGKIATCIVTVKAAQQATVAVTGVKLNKTSLRLEVGKTETLTATISPTNATNKNITWSTNNGTVATVSNGTVKAIKAGTAIITAKAINGGKIATCIVTVKAIQPATVAVTGIKLNKTSMTLEAGKTETLTATVTPKNATIKGVTWSTNNSAIATVSGGKVTAIKAGTAIITAKTVDGNKTVSCNVEVKSSEVTGKKIEINWSGATVLRGATRIFEFPDGELIIGYENNKKIYTEKSYDDGNSWHDKAKASFKEDYDCTNINFFYYNNALLMSYRATGKNSKSKLFHTGLYVSVSYDKGKSWSEHSTIIEYEEKSQKGVWEPVLGTINGQLAVFYSNDSTKVNGSSGGQRIEYKLWNGNGWGERNLVYKNGSKRPGMPVWQQLDDGTILVAIEHNTKGAGYFVIQLLCSTDKNGQHWSSPKDVYVPTKSKRMANAPSLVVLPNTQRIVVGFHTSESLSSNSPTGPMFTVYTDVSASEVVAKLKAGKSIKEYFTHKQNIFDATAAGEISWGNLFYANGHLYASGMCSRMKRVNVK